MLWGERGSVITLKTSFPFRNLTVTKAFTALILNGHTIQAQIRSCMMHQVAEYGMASHWTYIDEIWHVGMNGSSALSRGDELYNTPWLLFMKEWQNDRISSCDFVDNICHELLGKRIVVFLHNGTILILGYYAAFQMHT
jgi:(p)ppGpp synthase/HD superfamily hydrolase